MIDCRAEFLHEFRGERLWAHKEHDDSQEEYGGGKIRQAMFSQPLHSSSPPFLGLA